MNYRNLPYKRSRMQFRRLRQGDLPDFHSYRNDPDVARLQGWSPMSKLEAKEFIKAHASIDSLTPGRWSQLAIATMSEDFLIGDVGLWLSLDSSEAEFGLTISPKYQGLGLGTETVCCIIDFLFQNDKIRSIFASADVRNTPCLASLASAGMIKVESNEAVFKGEVCREYMYRIERPEE